MNVLDIRFHNAVAISNTPCQRITSDKYKIVFDKTMRVFFVWNKVRLDSDAKTPACVVPMENVKSFYASGNFHAQRQGEQKAQQPKEKKQ